MEKAKLVGIIQAAEVSEELKTRLLGMVGEQEEVGAETMKNIQAELDKSAEEAIQDVVNLQVVDAKAQFDGEMAQVDGQIAQFNRELSQKADEQDMATARDTISRQE